MLESQDRKSEQWELRAFHHLLVALSAFCIFVLCNVYLLSRSNDHEVRWYVRVTKPTTTILASILLIWLETGMFLTWMWCRSCLRIPMSEVNGTCNNVLPCVCCLFSVMCSCTSGALRSSGTPCIWALHSFNFGSNIRPTRPTGQMKKHVLEAFRSHRLDHAWFKEKYLYRSGRIFVLVVKAPIRPAAFWPST